MTIRKKIYTSGMIVFLVFVSLALMNIWTHQEVSSIMRVRDDVDKELDGIQAFLKWKDDLMRLVSDISASGHVPSSAGEQFYHPTGSLKEEYNVLGDSGQRLVEMIGEKEQSSTGIDEAFGRIRNQVNVLYQKLDDKIATVLATAQLNQVLGLETSEQSALAPYVLKSLNQLTLVAMNGLISRHISNEEISVVEKNRRFVSSQLQLLDPDGSIAALFAELFAQIEALEELILQSNDILSLFETRIAQAKDAFRLAVTNTQVDVIIGRVQSNLNRANENLERASRRSLATVVVFLLFVPLLVIVIGIFGLNTIVVGPITHLMEAMKHIEGGRYDVTAPVRAQDEIGQLARAFNVMAAEIDARVTEMSRLNRVMRESETKYRTLVDNLPQRIFLKDQNSVYISCNRNFADDMHTTETEIVGKTDFDLFSKELAEKYRGDDARVLLSDSPEEIEETYVKEGKELVVETVKTSIRDDNGEVSGVLGIFWDITRRKEMESSLQLYKYIFDTVAIDIFLVNENGEFIDVNNQACDSLGYTREDLRKMRLLDIDPFFTPEMWDRHRNDLQSKGLINIETQYRHKGGNVFPAQMLDNFMTFEGKELHVIFAQDISERRRMEQALKESEERLDLALAGANEGIWDWYIEQNTIYFDSRYYTMAGYQPNEFPGAFEEWEKRVHKDDVENVKSVIDRYLAGDLNAYEVAFRFLRKDGSYMWIHGKGKVVERDNEGNPVRFIGTHSDITDRKRMEEMMIQSEKMLSMGGLAAGMAHEINNPLAGIVQTAEVMANRLGAGFDIPANRKVAEAAGTTMEAIEQFMNDRGIPRMLATITESGQRVAEIVGNMLSFARKSEATISSCDLGMILDKTTELAATDYDLRKQYDFKRIEIRREYAQNVPEVPCESVKIQQVLLNILRNGAQAMQSTGTELPRFILRTRFEPHHNMAAIEIEDNGPGMDEETRKRVFEPFFTTKPVGVGTGLGLSISYFIVTENHGGEMSVESHPGAGATFIIRLPVG